MACEAVEYLTNKFMHSSFIYLFATKRTGREIFESCRILYYCILYMV